MRIPDSTVRESGGDADLRASIRAEFARLDVADTELASRLESAALAAVETCRPDADGLDPVAAAGLAVAVVDGAHTALATVTDPAPGPTVGDLSTRQLIAHALRPRRTARRAG